MTASEFAFLALGLVLGVATGAALVEVARARPPARREIRVTIAPNSIRSRASTLADAAPMAVPVGPARGGPADRRWVDREYDPAETPHEDAPSPNRTPVPNGSGSVGAGPDRSSPAPARWVSNESPAGSAARESVGIAIARETDPMMAALRRSTNAETRWWPGPAAETELPIGSPVVSAIGPSGGAATMMFAGSRVTATDRSRGGQPRKGRGAAAPAKTKLSRTDAGPSAGDGSGLDPNAPAGSGPCADRRRVADERCAVATRARDGARRAAETLRTAQRDYDDHVGQAENLASDADPRSVRTAKETAQQAFRKARAAASTRDAIEAAARDWLTEINRINHATRESQARADQHRKAAAESAPALERLALEADAARISAETAEEACVAAREAVATCEEAAAAASPTPPARTGDEDMPPAEDAGTHKDIAAAASVATETAGLTDDDAMGSRAGEDAAIIRLLRGDREILPRIVAKLGGDNSDEQQRWRGLLTAFLEAVVARSVEAAWFDFPTDHPFWGPFSRSQGRDIMEALASLGYRHDGFGDWADDRVPSQRDLSLAVGYAGLDPMRVRRWPSEAEMGELLSEVTVAADEFVWEAAGSLTLGELISLLGRRADGLTDLWNEWGAVRQLLLSGG